MKLQKKTFSDGQQRMHRIQDRDGKLTDIPKVIEKVYAKFDETKMPNPRE